MPRRLLALLALLTASVLLAPGDPYPPLPAAHAQTAPQERACAPGGDGQGGRPSSDEAGGDARPILTEVPGTAGAKPAVTEVATFGMGCFWGAEADFCGLRGVIDTEVGYAGGTTPNPDYRQVSSGRTGHAEVVQVRYDPAVVSYEELLEVFWRRHDPTTANRQGPDVGTQYRSLILFHGPAQERAARASLATYARRLSRPIVTEIEAAGPFYPAEDYHQRYLQRRGRASCNR
jgi:peptide-methionine (S)-S-oxide reductase